MALIGSTTRVQRSSCSTDPVFMSITTSAVRAGSSDSNACSRPRRPTTLSTMA